MFRRLITFSAIVGLIFANFPVQPASGAEDNSAPVSQVIFNEIRLGGSDLDPADDAQLKEYVTLYNSGDADADLEGWVLEYAKSATSAFDSQYCSASSWSGVAGITVSVIKLEDIFVDVLEPGSITSPIKRQLNNTGSGSLRLIDASDPENVIIHDIVGWGDNAPCSETDPAQTPATSKSLVRQTDCDDLPIDTDDNSADFVVADSNPLSLGPNEPGCDGPIITPSCDGVIITEILPNPASTDKDKEFIELHNPTDEYIDLIGCVLLTSDGKLFKFTTSIELEPGEYRAFYDDVSGITLTNSRSVEVVIASPTTEYPAAPYPANLKDDISWALIDGMWQETDNVTPGAVNKPATPEEKTKGSIIALKPCPDGKFRNPATNRCKKIASDDGLVPCKAGQYRNPETNRCKSIAASASSLVPCKPGQTRNPATNRCKKADSASTLKPCKEGQERNPETNRCRKVETLASTTGANPGGGTGEGGSRKTNYIIVGTVASLAAGYGLFEYRRDILGGLTTLKSRLFPISSK